MAAYSFFCYLVLVPLSCASIIRNGVKLVALPIPGTIYKNGSIVVNSKSEQSDIGGNQVQAVHTVTVKTPVATLTFSNASQYEKSIVQQAKSSLENEVSALRLLDPSELIDLDVPVRVNDLLELAKSPSPTKFREKIDGSKLMEKLIDTVQQKSIELYTLKNELESVAGSHKIVKRESTFDAPAMPDRVWKPVPYAREVQWWPTSQSGQWWPVVVPILNTNPESSSFARSIEEKAVHVPIHHHNHPHVPHLLHRAHLPHHRPVPRLPNLHLLPLLRSEALPILRFPLALLNFILARPVQPPLSTPQSMMDPPLQPMSAGLERPHRGPPQLQPYHSLADYHGQETSTQLPERLPELYSQVNPVYYVGSVEQQADTQVDQILASVHKNTAVTNYKPISPWEGIFFSLFRDFSLT